MTDNIFQTSRMLALPPENHILLFYALPNMETTARLRLTCRKFELIFQEIKHQVIVIQRKRLIAPFAAFYDFLELLKRPDGALQHPPPSGWPIFGPNITQSWDKTELTMEVLRHLPYISEENGSNVIDLSTFAVDYTAPQWNHPLTRQKEEEMITRAAEKEAMNIQASAKRHIFCIVATCDDRGTYLFLNTFTGLIHALDCGKTPPYYHTTTPQEYCNSRIATLERLDRVFVNGFNPVTIRERREEDDDANDHEEDDEMEEDKVMAPFAFQLGRGFDRRYLRFLYRKHGWPGEDWNQKACREDWNQKACREDWNKKACQEELVEYVEYWILHAN